MTDSGEASVETTESTGGSDAWGAFESVPAMPHGEGADTTGGTQAADWTAFSSAPGTGSNSDWSAFDSAPAAPAETTSEKEKEQWSAFDSSQSVPAAPAQ